MINELVELVTVITNEKTQKKRKDAFTKFISLIRVDKTKEELNLLTQQILSGELDQKSTFSWKDIILASIAHIDAEIEGFKKRKSTKKTDDNTPGILKMVKSIADSTKCNLHLSIRDIFEHIITVLRDMSLMQTFCQQYCQLVVELLSEVGYCNILKKTYFSDLVKIANHLINVERGIPSSTINHVTRMVLQIVRTYPVDFADLLPKLIPFYQKALGKETGIEENKSTLNLLESMNFLVYHQSFNEAKTFLDLGNSLFFPLCNLLKKTRDLQFKYHLIQFFRMQLHICKQLSSNLEIEESLFTDLTKLRYLIETIFFIIERDYTSSTSSNLRQTTNTKFSPKEIKSSSNILNVSGSNSSQSDSEEITDNFVDFTARLFYIISRNDKKIVEIVVEKQQRVIKRRKVFDIPIVDNIWDLIIFHMNENKASPNLQIFLQISAKLIQEFSSVITQSFITNLCNLITEALDQLYFNEKPEVLYYIFQNLLEISKIKPVHDLHSATWLQIYNYLMKNLISFTQYPYLVDTLVELLSSILSNSLIDKSLINSKQEHIWNLLNNQNYRCSSATLELLHHFISKYTLIDHPPRDNSVNQREVIIRWLLSSVAVNTSSKSFPSFLQLPAEDFVSVLCLIIYSKDVPPLKSNNRTQKIISKLQNNNISSFSSYHFTRLIKYLNLIRSQFLNEEKQHSNSDHTSQNTYRQQLPAPLRNSLQKLVVEKLKANINLIAELEGEVKKRKTLGVDYHLLSVYLLHILFYSKLLISLHYSISHLSNYFKINSNTSNSNIFLTDLMNEVLPLITLCFKYLTANLPLLTGDMQKFYHRIFAPFTSLLSMCVTYQIPSDLLALLSPLANCFVSILEPLQSQTAKNNNDDVDMKQEDVISLSDDDEFASNNNNINSTFKMPNEQIVYSVKIITMFIQISNVNHEKFAKLFYSLLDTNLLPLIKFEMLEALIAISVQKHKVLILNHLQKILLDASCSSDQYVRKKILHLISVIIEQCRIVPPHSIGREAMEVISNVLQIFLEIWKGKKLHWTTRKELVKFTHKLLSIDADRFDSLTSVFLQLIKDPNSVVRLKLSKDILLLFKLYSEEVMIFNDIMENLTPLINSAIMEERFTCLLTLSSIILSSKTIEKQILLKIIQFCNDKDLVHCIHPMLQAVSVKLSYPSLRSFIEVHLSYLIGEWMSSNKLAKFPFSLTEVNDEQEFLNRYSHLLVPKIIYLEKLHEIEWVADQLGIESKTLIVNNFASIYAFCFPLHYCEDKNQQDLGDLICDVILLKFLSQDEVSTLVSSNMDQILSLLMEYASGDLNSPPYYLRITMKRVFENLSQRLNCSLSSLFCQSPFRTHKIILHLRKRFSSSEKIEYQKTILNSFELFVEVIDNKIIEPYILRELIYFFLHSATRSSKSGNTNSEIQTLSCKMLYIICEKGLSINAEVISDYINILVSSLTPIIHQCQLSLNIIELIIEKNPKIIQKISEIDQLPDIPEFADLITKMDQMYKTATAISIENSESDNNDIIEIEDSSKTLPLQIFGKKSKTEKLLLKIVKDLQNAISHSQLTFSLDSLINLLHKGTKLQRENNREEFDNLSKNNQLIWLLIGICSSEHSEEIKTKAAICLGELGFINPYAIAFTSHENRSLSLSLFASSPDISSPSSSSGSNGGSNDNTEGDLNIPFQVIKMMATFIVDHDINVSSEASQFLSEFLRTKVGRKCIPEIKRVDADLYSYLLPFFPKSRSTSKPISEIRDITYVKKYISLEELWNTEGRSYAKWICNFSSGLCLLTNQEIWRLASSICKYKVQFAEFIFPFLLFEIVVSWPIIQKTISAMMKKYIFFISESDESHADQNTLKKINHNLEIIQLFLSTLSYFRQEILKRQKTTDVENKLKHANGETATRFWDSEFWFQINFLQIAKIAQQSSAYLTSLQYIEFWYESQFSDSSIFDIANTVYNNVTDETSTLLMSNSQLPLNEKQQNIARNLLLNAYANINEPDAIHGMNYSFEIDSQLKIYEHEANWQAASSSYDRILQSFSSNLSFNPKSSNENDSMHIDDDHRNHHRYSTPSTFHETSKPEIELQLGLLTSLRNHGFEQLLSPYLQGLSLKYSSQFHHFSEQFYEMNWRSANWDLDSTLTEMLSEGNDDITTSSTHGFHKEVYECLKSINDGQTRVVNQLITSARLNILRNLQFKSLENTKSVYPVLSQLRFLGEIERIWNWSCSTTSKLESFDLTDSIGELTSNSFDFYEPLLALRTVLFSLLKHENSLINHLQNTARLAIKSHRFQMASNVVYKLKHVVHSLQDSSSLSSLSSRNSFTLSHDKKLSWMWEECKILWKHNDRIKAISAAKQLIHLISHLSSLNHSSNQSSSLGVSDAFDDQLTLLYANILLTTGKWLAGTASVSSNIIIQDYLMGSINILQHSSGVEKSKAFYVLGSYTDNLFQNINTKLNSSEWEASNLLRNEKEKEFSEGLKILKTLPQSDQKSIGSHLANLKRQTQLQTEESNKLQRDMDQFLELAITNYISSLLEGSEKFDTQAIFRICSLWFSNSQSDKINQIVHHKISKIPSYKWLPLIYQIASRITTTSSSKNPKAEKNFQLALKALLLKLSLEHPHHTLYQVFALSRGDKIHSKFASHYVIDHDKMNAALQLLKHLKKTQIAKLVSRLETLGDAYIDVALLTIPPNNQKAKELPLPPCLSTISNYHELAVVTSNIPINKDTNYDNLVSIVKFGKKYKLVGGLNLPKLTQCYGSDGNIYPQLIKGIDDLRQDAVMEQIFTMVNQFLSFNFETRKRRLCIKTYKVIPLSPCAGLLEWVENTIPIGLYLTGVHGNIYDCAHARYRPNDLLSGECRKLLTDTTDESKKFEVFLNICENFKPVFHHFFLENFQQSSEWYERRIAYTRSVASSSIVGYIVGLGDRHISNILIDKSSAEVVHIDLGVAFDQGKLLRTPENIPFRLTRDLIDGMGITGVEGVFRRCCEETMKVLRDQQQSLLTIVEVFLHDPLYKWAISPLKSHQSNPSNNLNHQATNKDAEKTLQILKQKLQGVEYGEVLSVEGQVNQLINEAKDPERLCKLFPGWHSWV